MLLFNSKRKNKRKDCLSGLELRQSNYICGGAAMINRLGCNRKEI